MNPSQTLREIAALTPNAEIKAQIDVLAAQFELQHNAQNGQWQAVFGKVENHVYDQIAAMRHEMAKDRGNTEAKLQAILDLFDKLQREIYELQQAVLPARARGDDATGNQ